MLIRVNGDKAKLKPTAHVYTSAVLAAALYAHSHSIPESTICFAGGILIDLDHVIDFVLFSGEKFSPGNFVSWCENRWQRVTLLFHSYELLSLLFIIMVYLDSAVLRGILWGAGLHLLLDQLWNPKAYGLSPLFYFIGFRIAAGFRREKMQVSQRG